MWGGKVAVVLIGICFYLSPYYVIGSSRIILPNHSQEEWLQEAQQRLQAVRFYSPNAYYRWKLQFKQSRTERCPGTLIGRVEGNHHYVQVTFCNGSQLLFDKTHPQWILYPHRLCLYPETEWGKSLLSSHTALNAYVLTMAFLNWPIQSCVPCRKLGRKAIHITLAKGAYIAHVFMDKAFNTIIQADLYHRVTHCHHRFILKHLKKFSQGWGLREAVFVFYPNPSSQPLQTTLKVLSVDTRKPCKSSH